MFRIIFYLFWLSLCVRENMRTELVRPGQTRLTIGASFKKASTISLNMLSPKSEFWIVDIFDVLIVSEISTHRFGNTIHD